MPHENVYEKTGNVDKPDTDHKDEAEPVENIPPHAPDGGYGWVIVFACFILQCAVPGIISVFGVFLPQFLDYYGSSRGRTAIIGSMLSACTMIPGPFVSVLTSLFGCRKVAILGGCFITLGLLLSTLAPNVNVLILTFGFISGIGIGLIYLPLIVMVGFWFEKKRAIAMGITTSGAGIGMMIMGSLSGIFLEYFDWKNAIVLMSGLTLQLIVCGALLRPVTYERTINQEQSKDQSQHIYDKDTIIQPMLITTKKDESSKGYSSLDSALHKLHINNHNDDDDDLNSKSKNNNQLLLPKHPLYLHKHKVDDDEVYFSEQNLSSKSRSNCKNKKTLNPLLKKDIFYSGSIQHIPKEKVRERNVDPTSNGGPLLENKNARQKLNCFENKESIAALKKMLGVSILSDVSFIIILMSNALFQTGFVICICFITDYGISIGIPPERATYLVSAFGIGTTLGRIAGGAVTLIPKVGPVQATSASQILAGLCSLSIPLFCDKFISLSIFAGLTGFFLAPIIPLTAVMQVDFLGLDNLTNAHGMVSLGKGIVSLFGAPVAGLLQDVTGSPTPPFYLTAAILILAGVLLWFLPLCSRKCGSTNKS